ncbi:hypothetical protein G5V59_19240 [Nocardioides sp. W3-2-3]|uniref:hypothetical protein n=1 Tax=Nocardioides convexus TaxID=2712224 RepID=UPI0024183E15|nr:hypothetical protein [Nocardioides convexus]NHA01264.1 hypothetical protein [Nocardioides convexus]
MWDRGQIPSETSDQAGGVRRPRGRAPAGRLAACPAHSSRPWLTRCSAWTR